MLLGCEKSFPFDYESLSEGGGHPVILFMMLILR